MQGTVPAAAGPGGDPRGGGGEGSMGPWGVGAATGGGPAGGAARGSRASEKGRTGRSSAERTLIGAPKVWMGG